MTALDRLKQAFPGWECSIRLYDLESHAIAVRGSMTCSGSHFREERAVDACIAAWHEAVRPLVKKAVLAADWLDQEAGYTDADVDGCVRRVLGEDK